MENIQVILKLSGVFVLSLRSISLQTTSINIAKASVCNGKHVSTKEKTLQSVSY